MKAGIFLNSSPDGGGTYQYNLSVIRALESLPEQVQITAFVTSDGWQLPDRFQKILVPLSRIERAAGRLLRTICGVGLLRAAAPLVYRCVRAMNRSGCDVILFPSQDLYACLVKPRAIAAIHDLMHRYHPQFAEYGGGDARRRDMLYRAICRYAAGILVDSETGRSHVVESYGRDPETIFPLPFVPPFYLTETPSVDVRAAYDLPERYVFYPAQFWEHKNHLNLIRAIGILRSRGLAVPVVLCGSRKENYEPSMALIRELSLEAQFRVLGYVSNEEMASLYRGAEALVFVSLIGPTNIPPLEGMLLGCPVIVSNRYAMPDQVGEAGILVNPEDPADIADAIERVWSSADLRRELKEKGRRQVARWTQKEFSERLTSIIEKVC